MKHGVTVRDEHRAPEGELRRQLTPAARCRVRIIRQASAWIDALTEALPLAPSTQYRKPVLLVLGVTPMLAGAIEASLRAMRIDLPAVLRRRQFLRSRQPFSPAFWASISRARPS